MSYNFIMYFDAYDEGREAFISGKEKANPYQYRSDKWVSWEKGWFNLGVV